MIKTVKRNKEMETKDQLFKQLGFSDEYLTIVNDNSFIDQLGVTDKIMSYIDEVDNYEIDLTSSLIEKSEMPIFKTI